MRGRSKKRVQYSQYIPPTDSTDSTPSTDTSSTIRTRHTSYATNSEPVRSFIDVDVSESTAPAIPEHGSSDNLAMQDVLDLDTRDVQVLTPEAEGDDFDDINASLEDEIRRMEAMGLSGEAVSNSQRKRQRTQADLPMSLWEPFIDTYIDEFLRLDGRGDAVNQTRCATESCQAEIASPRQGFRCLDCTRFVLLCSSCIVESHTYLLFHRLLVWTGTYFEKTSLKSLGLRIQLGHPMTEKCLLPVPAFNDSFVIVDSDGIYEVALDFCGCGQSISKVIQLLRARLFPSTVIDPKTAATFRVLETFQMLTFTSKISGYEFFRALARRTDNTGIEPLPDRYQAFMRMVREWRHVRMLKRAGRGHDSTGVKGTKLGECAVLCPACPMPEVNLPHNWRARPESEKWLDSLFIGIDANFRLKRMNVSSDERDPGLNHGYAYIVEEHAFKSYLHQYDNSVLDEKSTCNNHDAIKSASVRGGRGTAASGLGTVECSRHDMKRPVAVGDLQRGERYVNMDYFFLSSLSNNSLERLVVSYDIACQWSKNLVARSQIYPPNLLSRSPDLDIEYLVPKFHLPAHVIACQLDYSFNLIPRVGRTDGEAPERGWAAANAVATSTREMGPGSRRDVLDDHFGDYNWRKIMDIAKHFLRKCEDAISARQEHVEAFIEFDAALSPALTTEWTVLCQTWERDRSQVNPFRNTSSKLTDAEVRLRLAQDDERPATVAGIPTHFSMTPSFFIYQGLDIEDQQKRLEFEIAELGPHSTALQQAKVVERSNTLRRRIEGWIEIQHFYLPALITVRARLEEAGGGKPISVQHIELFLPSQIHSKVTCPLLFLRYEWQLRCARAGEALNDLRGQILMRTMMRNSKARHARGQTMQTRSTKLLHGVEKRVAASANRYRRIREALTSLAVPLIEVSWVDEFRTLEDVDLIGLTSFDDGGPEGRKKLSWIWKVQGTGNDVDPSGQEALRIEWCKSRARAHRWQEECLLLNEEMQRIIRTFQWQSNQWFKIAEEHHQRQSTSAHDVPVLNVAEIDGQDIIKEGKVAFAHRQATIRSAMVSHCESVWRIVLPRLRVMDGGYDPRVMVEHSAH